MKYEFDYQLRQYEACVTWKQKSLTWAKECLENMKKDRLHDRFSSPSFRNSMMTHATSFRRTALHYHFQAKKHRACLVQMHENAHYDQYAETNVA